MITLRPIQTTFFKLIEFGGDVLSSCANSNNFQTVQVMIENCFFLIGNPTIHNQLHLVWNICYFIEINTKRLRVLQLVKKLFQQISWSMKTCTF